MNRQIIRDFAILSALANPLLLISTNAASGDVRNMGPGLTSLSFVPVTGPINSDDTEVMNDGTKGYGAVPYSYHTGKYEVTAGQYAEFLNAVAKVDTYGLYHVDMRDSIGCRIQRSNTSAGYSYTVEQDWANRPVNFVSFWDAARFANWLHNGQPVGPQGPGTTEDGAYPLNGYNGLDGTGITRNASAKFWIPTEDEWYKAAYYDPSTGGYWDYPTDAVIPPSNDLVDPDPGNNANIFALLESDQSVGGPYFRSEAGAFENSPSPYGTYDQGGNVSEWTETIAYDSPGLDRRALRGGSFDYTYDYIHASYRNVFNDPTSEYGSIGFRVASIVPEPQIFLMAALGIYTLLWCDVRKRRIDNCR